MANNEIPTHYSWQRHIHALLLRPMWYGIRSKTWSFMGTMCFGLLGEIVGYIGRIMLNLNPFIMNNFLV
jgi:hypothetical protein